MPTPEEEAAQKAADETKAKDDAAKLQGKTFTQAELDAIIKERLDRVEEKTKKERAAEALRIEQETAAKNGEWQKLAETREKEIAQIKADADAARAELDGERFKIAAVAKASEAIYGSGKQKFISAEKAYKLVKFDNPAITADELPAALAKLAKESPEMLEAGPVIPGGPARPKTPIPGAADLSKAPRQSY